MVDVLELESLAQIKNGKCMQYAIGTKFIKVGRKDKSVWTVRDILKTYNSASELVKIRYVADHLFCGQLVTDSDVNEVTIARGIAELSEI